MTIQEERDGDKKEVRRVVVEIDGTRYTLSQSIDKKLTINKVSDNGDDYLKVYPRSGNEIELS